MTNPPNPPNPLNPSNLPNPPSPWNPPSLPSPSHLSNRCPHPPNPLFKDSQFDVWKKKKNISYVKTLAPYFTFCNFFWQHFLPFLKHMFLNAPKIEWCLILPKILKAKYNVKEVVNFIFMLPNLLSFVLKSCDRFVSVTI